MVGICPKAESNAASDRLASSLIPARSNSLLFAGRTSLIERCFSSSITAYSALGMVKLSRISLSFFALCGAAVFSGFAAPTALKSGAVATVFGGRDCFDRHFFDGNSFHEGFPDRR